MRPASTSTPGGGAGVSPWLPMDAYSEGYGDGIFCVVSGTATYSVEITADNVFDPTVTPVAFPCNVAALTAATGNASGALLQGAKACRANQASGSGSVKLTLITRGVQ